MPDEDALLSALTTEHFVLQSARGVITSEGAARATLYVGAVSSALVALGFTSELGSEAYAWFLAAVLPALVVLGEFTFVRLVEVSVEDLRYLRQIQRIRQYYATLSADAGRFFPNAGDDVGDASLFRFMGLGARRMQTLFTAATAVAAINAIITGVGIAALVRWLDAPVAVAAVVGIAVATAFVALHLRWERRRYVSGLADP